MASDQNDAHRYAGPVSLSVPKWCERFIGIPYKDNGHGFDGANCAGIVYLVLKEQAAIAINPHADVSAADVARATSRLEVVASCAPWSAVAGDPRRYDVGLFRGSPLHTGIVVASGLLLHVWRAPASCVMGLDNPRIRNHIIGFYRHDALA